MAFSDIGLLFKIKADADQAKREMGSLRSVVQKEIAAVTGSSGFGGIASVATAAVAGIAAVGGAAIAAGTAIFNLAKQSSDYGSEIFDASQKTGLSTVSLSALKLAADQSGASLSDVTRATTLLSRTVAEAARGSDEAAAKLKRLGVDPKEAIKDLDGTLSKVFKTINDAKTPIEQTAAATDAFGKSGAALIPVIKSFDGDMAVLVKRAKELGLALSEEDARAADEFGDTLDTLTAQAKGVAFTFVRQFTPDLTRSMAAVSLAMQQNQSVAVQWGQEFGSIMRGTANAVDTQVGRIIGKLVELIPYLTVSTNLLLLLGAGAKEFDTGTKPLGYTGPPVPVPRSALLTKEDFAGGPTASPYNVTGGGKGGGGKGKGGGGKDEAQRREMERLQLFNKELESITKTNSEILKREYDRNLKSLEDYYAQAQIDSEQHYQDQLRGFAREEEIARKYIKNAEDLALKLADIKLRREDAADQKLADSQKLADEKRDALSKAKFAHAKATYELNETLRDAEIDNIKNAVERHALIESNGETQIVEIRRKGHDERLRLLNAELEDANQNQEKRAEILDKIKAEETDWTVEFEALSARRRAAIDAEVADRLAKGLNPSGLTEEQRLTEEQKRGNLIQAEVPPALIKHIDVLKTLKATGVDAFGSIAKGAGQLLQNYILLGTAGPHALRKMTAAVLASVAAEAAVKAIFALAEGFIHMFTNPAQSAADFTAAALYGSIAGVAAVAGRALAGNLFQNDARDALGTPTGSQLSAQDRGTDTRTENRDRGGLGPRHFIVEVVSNDSHILNVTERAAQRPGGYRNAHMRLAEG